MPGYTYLWEFQVKPGCEGAFLEHYGAEGTWARLFRSAPGFVETRLLKDRTAPLRYVTIDRWQNGAAYDAFKRAFARQYTALDAACEDLTVSESCLGSYDE